MSTRSIGLSEELHAYLMRVSVREPDLLRRLREETAEMPQARMQISPEQGQLMRLLVELIGAKRILEIGTFTGYSAISMAMSLPEDGLLVACDVSEEFTSVARRYFKEAGLDTRIDLRIAPAVQTTQKMIEAGEAGSFDFAFIDADKSNYLAYLEAALVLVRSGGLIAFDNTLWGGDVADPSADHPDTVAIRALNEKMGDDPRFSRTSLVPIGDGLTLARKA